MKHTTVIFLALLVLALLRGSPPVTAAQVAAEPQAASPTAKVIELAGKSGKEQPILGGMPESYRMRSGLIMLAPGETVGQHSTKNNEELLIVLEGSGEMIFGDRTRLALHANSALYCPPDTVHDVLNSGTGTLRYVYVVSQAK